MTTKATPRKRAQGTAKRAAATRRQRKDPLVKAWQATKILSMWIAGDPPSRISEEVGLSESTIYRVRKEALQAAVPLRGAKAEELRELELQRLDELQAAHWPVAVSAGENSDKSAKIVLGCIDRRVKMLGLDAPVRVDARIQGQLDAEIEQLIEQLSANGGLVKLVE